MQTLVTASPEVMERPAITIRLETVAYLALIVLALVLRVADLGGVPLVEGETRQALAAYRAVIPGASGESIIPTSPILFAAQGLAFGTLGGSEFSARFLTALGGAVLVLLPLLFRRELGGTRTLIVSLLLVLSPTALVGARLSAPAIWSLIFAVMLIWGARRWWNRAGDESGMGYQIIGAVGGAGLVFLSEPGGVVLGLIIGGAALVSLLWSRLTANEFDDLEPKDKPGIDTPRASLNQWATPLFVAVLFVVLIGTGILLYPSGLSAIGEVFAGFLRGFGATQPDGVQPLALVVSLFYEPFLWLFGITGAIIVLFVQRRGVGAVERFLIGWLVCALIASVVWGATDVHHALWFTVPLIGLTSALVLEMLTPVRSTDIFNPPVYARWIVAAAAIAVLAVFTVSAQALARSLLNSTSNSLTSITPNANSIVLVVVSILFMIIGFFLVASMWGNRTSLQGVGLGVLIFGALTSLGSGWNAVYGEIDNPREPYHLSAVSNDVTLLRNTLYDLAERNSGGFAALRLTVLAPQDGSIAWLVRDFSNAEFISGVEQAIGDPVVLLPNYEEAPFLGSSYVGQDFITRRTWNPNAIYLIDYPTWWMQRHARFSWMTLETNVLWVRMDVYQGTVVEDTAG